jgi:S1-C subfamily serine protease
MNAYEFVFPVIEGNLVEDAKVVHVQHVIGTCFSIGNGFFLTAAHVVPAALDRGWIGYPVDKVWQIFALKGSEINQDVDIAIIQADVPNHQVFKWQFQSLGMWEPARTIGFPYALDLKYANLNVRGLSGQIVSELSFYGLKAEPRVYELSFQAPRGLSGAPLLVHSGTVGGMVIGNKSTEMQIFSDREILADGKQEKIVERYEALQLGIALTSAAIIDLDFKIIGGNLRNYLMNSKLAG